MANKQLSLSLHHNVGSAKPLRLADDITSAALYDGPHDCYRYTLKRVWNPDAPLIMWIMMNPSVATEYGDDRTVAKCQRYARAWGYGGILIGNSFAYRCTDQRRLIEVNDPIGPHNNQHLLLMAQEAAHIILAYGTPQIKTLQKRGPEIAKMLYHAGFKLSALRLSRKGQRPEHPLYLPASLSPVSLSIQDIL